MEIIGIICEYNPFHNGHIYHIKKIKELHPNSIIILVLNGYFLERGEISTISKYDKTRLALLYNVDIVIELPTLYGTQSADNFAYNAIYLLNKLEITHLIFGSESNDINKIKEIANLENNDTYNKKIKELLDKGINYPTAMAKALNIKFNFLPNDLLGISYVKAINKINKNIIPKTIKRTNDYLDTKENEGIISATNIREKIKNNIDIAKFVPNQTIKYINPINYDLYFNLLKIKIIISENLNEYLDVDEGIENRLKEKITCANNIDDFIKEIKTKRYTFNKINRMLIHILLGIKKTDTKEKINYLKILGMNKTGKKYLNTIKKDLDISLNPDKNSRIYKLEINASIIYDMLTNKNTYKEEKSGKPIF